LTETIASSVIISSLTIVFREEANGGVVAGEVGGITRSLSEFVGEEESGSEPSPTLVAAEVDKVGKQGA